MSYINFFLLMLLLVGVTICFFWYLWNSWLPGNAKLLVEAWNLMDTSHSQADSVQCGKDDKDNLSSVNNGCS